MDITMDTQIRCTKQLCSMTESELITGTDIPEGSTIRYVHRACDGGRVTAYTSNGECLYEYYLDATADGTTKEVGGGFVVTSDCYKVCVGQTVTAYCDVLSTVADIISDAKDLAALVDVLSDTELTDEELQGVINLYFEHRKGISEDTAKELIKDKADLVNGKVPYEQLPAFEDKADLVGGTVPYSQLPDFENKADLVSGKVPYSQLPTFDNKADLVSGKVPYSQLPDFEDKADLVNGVLPVSQMPSEIGLRYTNTKSVQITTAGIDTHTNGATVTIPAGVYVITANAQFESGKTTGERNIQIRVLAGTSSIGVQRIFAAGSNYASLQVTAIYRATADTKLTVQKSSSIVESASANTSIVAVRIK